MPDNNSEHIKQLIVETLTHMGFESEIFERAEEGRTVFNIKTPDAQLLIGRQGNNLEALQHIVRLLAKPKPFEDGYSFALDVDDYKDKRTIFFKELARKAAHQVRKTGRGVVLPVMSASERRVVHNYLSLYSDLSSASTGREPGRRVVVRKKAPSKTDGDEFNFIENS